MMGGFSSIVVLAGVYFKSKVKDQINEHDTSVTAHPSRFRHFGRLIDETKQAVGENKTQLQVLSERMDNRFEAMADTLEKQDDQTLRLDTKLDRILEKVN